jgi:hypothetical protein
VPAQENEGVRSPCASFYFTFVIWVPAEVSKGPRRETISGDPGKKNAELAFGFVNILNATRIDEFGAHILEP